MPELLLIVLGTIVVNHFALEQSRERSGDMHAADFAAVMSVAVFSCVTLLLTAAVVLPLDRLLALPQNAPYLRLPLLVGVTAIVTQLLAFVRRRQDTLPLPAAWQPLVMTNCTLLVLGLESATRLETFQATLLLSLGLSAGFGLSLIALTQLFARIDQASIPRPFRGSPVVLITAGLAALALLGLAGVLPD